MSTTTGEHSKLCLAFGRQFRSGCLVFFFTLLRVSIGDPGRRTRPGSVFVARG